MVLRYIQGGEKIYEFLIVFESSHIWQLIDHQQQKYKVIIMSLLQNLRNRINPPAASSRRSITVTHRKPNRKIQIPSTRASSLPSIAQKTKIKIFNLQPKRYHTLEKLLLNKQKSLFYHLQTNRNKTQLITTKSKYKLTQKQQLLSNSNDTRTKPVDKYFHQLDNIRIAERLLVVKPSHSLQRKTHKKFYLQQSHYRSQISKHDTKLHKKKSKIEKQQWF